MYVFGIGSGCLYVEPLSETFGRNLVYLTFSFVYWFFVLGTALSMEHPDQALCRSFVELASTVTLEVNGASVGNMFRPVKRALWFPLIGWVNVVRRCSSKASVSFWAQSHSAQLR
jgi:DHA1 family multidrug resistance protein-like MFS transporter